MYNGRHYVHWDSIVQQYQMPRDVHNCLNRDDVAHINATNWQKIAENIRFITD